MNAIEFVKKFGWGEVRVLLEMLDRAFVPDNMTIGVIGGAWVRSTVGFTKLELEALVEAWELVEEFGGLEKAKLKVRLNNAAFLETSSELKQAINLVEQVDEN